MESGGKVPRRVCESIDKHLRKKIRQGHTACLQCLNYPTPAESSKMWGMVSRKTRWHNAIWRVPCCNATR